MRSPILFQLQLNSWEYRMKMYCCYYNSTFVFLFTNFILSV